MFTAPLQQNAPIFMQNIWVFILFCIDFRFLKGKCINMIIAKSYIVSTRKQICTYIYLYFLMNNNHQTRYIGNGC